MDCLIPDPALPALIAEVLRVMCVSFAGGGLLFEVAMMGGPDLEKMQGVRLRRRNWSPNSS